MADFNGDGKLDIVAGGIILLGNGDGTFTPGPSVEAAYQAVVADINGDGRADLVLTTDKGVDILLGNGDATFKLSQSFPSFQCTGVGVAVGDVNDDGKLDLIAAGMGAEVFYGNGDGTFSATPEVQFHFLGTGGSSSVIAVDLDGDGKADITSSQYASGVDVVLSKDLSSTPILDPNWNTIVTQPAGLIPARGPIVLPIAVMAPVSFRPTPLPVQAPTPVAADPIAAERIGSSTPEAAAPIAPAWDQSLLASPQDLLGQPDAVLGDANLI